MALSIHLSHKTQGLSRNKLPVGILWREKGGTLCFGFRCVKVAVRGDDYDQRFSEMAEAGESVKVDS